MGLEMKQMAGSDATFADSSILWGKHKLLTPSETKENIKKKTYNVLS